MADIDDANEAHDALYEEMATLSSEMQEAHWAPRVQDRVNAARAARQSVVRMLAESDRFVTALKRVLASTTGDTSIQEAILRSHEQFMGGHYASVDAELKRIEEHLANVSGPIGSA